MRTILPHLLVALTLSARVFSAAAPEVAQPANVEEDVLGIQKQTPNTVPVAPVVAAEEPTPEEEEEVQPTIFNGVSVPPLTELTGDGFGDAIDEGFWFVKHYSPYCHHCQEVAPIWQTIYEFYYTSKPQPSAETAETSAAGQTFEKFYNFHFGSLDCIAYGNLCAAHDIHGFPTFILFKNGKEVDRFPGSKNMNGLSTFIEEALESIRPGSRPKDLKLPEVGADHVQTQAVIGTTAAVEKPTAMDMSIAQAPAVSVSSVTTKTGTSALATVSPKASVRPEDLPNSAGTSFALTQESFQKLVTTTRDPWFIKFYAPWCHHCQALAPNWQQMAREMQGKLNVGEVNCDVESRLCKEVKIKGYPTVHFFRGGERVEYSGLRGLGDLVSYAKKAVDSGLGVKYVDAIGFKELEETEEVIFVYFYDHATTREDFEALERLTLSLIGHAILVKTDSAVLADRFKIHTWPRLVVSRDGRPSYYNALAPRDMRDFRQVLSWMQSVWLPILPELTASNSREIMDGRVVVLGILSRERSDDFQRSKREIKSAALEWMDKETHAFQQERQEMRDAKQLRIEEAEDRNDQRALRSAKSIRIQISESDRKQVGFAWVDGVFWERWIRTTYGIDPSQGEKVIINDEDHKRYWDMTASGSPIVPSRTSILETLPKIVADPPKLAPKYTTGKIQQVFLEARGASTSHPWISIGLLLGCVAGIALWGRGRIRRTKGSAGGFFQLDGKERILSGGTGKVD